LFLKNKKFQEVGDLAGNSLHEKGMDIFWNNTIATAISLAKSLSRIHVSSTRFKTLLIFTSIVH